MLSNVFNFLHKNLFFILGVNMPKINGKTPKNDPHPRIYSDYVFTGNNILVPPLSRAVLFPWWVPRSGMGSLLNFGLCLEPCHLRFFLNLRLLFLAVLESG